MKTLTCCCGLSLLMACSGPASKKPGIKNHDTAAIETKSIDNIQNPDSTTLWQYEHKLLLGLVDEGDSVALSRMSNKQLDSVLNQGEMGREAEIGGKWITVAPDSSFKVFTVEIDYCGAYCNPEYYSWVHFKSGNKGIVREIDCSKILRIHKLTDSNYLVLEWSWLRPMSALTAENMNAIVLSFKGDSIRSEDVLSYSQVAGSDPDSYLTYDEKKGQLSYRYLDSHDLYDDGLSRDDTLRKGYYIYKNGQFKFKRESVKRVEYEY